jgi:hypothetical protein
VWEVEAAAPRGRQAFCLALFNSRSSASPGNIIVATVGVLEVPPVRLLVFQNQAHEVGVGQLLQILCPALVMHHTIHHTPANNRSFRRGAATRPHGINAGHKTQSKNNAHNAVVRHFYDLVIRCYQGMEFAAAFDCDFADEKSLLGRYRWSLQR